MNAQWYIQLKNVQPKRLALLLGLWYVMYPVVPLLQEGLHVAITIVESTDRVLGHETLGQNHRTMTLEQHGQGTMQLDKGHGIIDFFTSLLNNSKPGEHQDSPIPQKNKLDKHLTKTSLQLPLRHNENTFTAHFFQSKKIIKGYPLKFKEPPPTRAL
ncbi:MAG: hypothetical protein AAGA86_15540 [Bacteroidota bacterium]